MMIFDIQECTFHDGPGGRITIFTKGCPLRCTWCHNPEGLTMTKEIMYKKNKCIHCNACDSFKLPNNCPTNALITVGQEMTPQEIINKVINLKDTLEMMEGGVTFSGGEPTLQSNELIYILKELQKNKIHTCIETCGYCDSNDFKEIIQYCDMVIMDIKIINEQDHIKYTKQSNKIILDNALTLMNNHQNYLFRTPLIPNITDTIDNLNDIKEFIKDSHWEQIPNNPLAYLKYEQIISKEISLHNDKKIL